MQEAKESAELIIREAQELADAILEKQRHLGHEEANVKGSSLLKKAADEAAVDRLRKLATAKITANWIVLSKKGEIITAVLKKAENKLLTWLKITLNKRENKMFDQIRNEFDFMCKKYNTRKKILSLAMKLA